MKISSQQWIEIIKLVSTFAIGVVSALFAQSCTASMSISKYNSNSSQRTEQTSTSSLDSIKMNIHR